MANISHANLKAKRRRYFGDLSPATLDVALADLPDPTDLTTVRAALQTRLTDRSITGQAPAATSSAGLPLAVTLPLHLPPDSEPKVVAELDLDPGLWEAALAMAAEPGHNGVSLTQEYDPELSDSSGGPFYGSLGGGGTDVAMSSGTSQVFITEPTHVTLSLTAGSRDERVFIIFDNSTHDNANVIGGTFKLTLDGHQTAAINASHADAPEDAGAGSAQRVAFAARVTTALEALPNIGPGNVLVSPDGVERAYQVLFQGDLGHEDVGDLTAQNTGLTGAGAGVKASGDIGLDGVYAGISTSDVQGREPATITQLLILARKLA